MYRRYQPNNSCQSTPPKAPAGPSKSPENHQNTCPPLRKPATQNKPKITPVHKKKTFLGGLIPPSLYNEETKKVLGFLSAEDLLLVALILLFMDNEDTDPIIIYALIYILISEYVDLPDILGF